MAHLLISNSSLSPSLSFPATQQPPPCTSFRPSHVPFHRTTIRFSRKTRGLTVVTRAGPTTSNYVFAFVLPLSLLAITVFASVRVSDKLDRDFYEEYIVSEAMKEADEDDEEEVDDNDNDNGEVILKEKVKEPAVPRFRNRPKREA